MNCSSPAPGEKSTVSEKLNVAKFRELMSSQGHLNQDALLLSQKEGWHIFGVVVSGRRTVAMAVTDITRIEKDNRLEQVGKGAPAGAGHMYDTNIVWTNSRSTHAPHSLCRSGNSSPGKCCNKLFHQQCCNDNVLFLSSRRKCLLSSP